ncbi:MAG: hypothetical protein HWD59_02455 [Coxiellaceae bacterium]|nr:MAG: hypothetical protein HWD59_02455 [Coxiellaceae bacterium]
MKRASQLVFIIIGLLLLGNVQAMADVAVEDHDTGPLQFGMIYSDQFGWIGTGKWTNYLTQNNAFAFQLDFGSREFRLGGTLGHQFTPTIASKLPLNTWPKISILIMLPAQNMSG